MWLLNTFAIQYDVCACLGQSMSVGSQGKPGGLQWTWLGHADVQFGGLTLHVSTLQMFILLQFNTQEVTRTPPGPPRACAHTHRFPTSAVLQEVGVDSVLKGCGLSKEVVLHALQPLIEDEGPLSCSHPQDPCQGLTHTHTRKQTKAP